MNVGEYLVTGEEMRRYDSNTVSEFRVPELILMEQAALAAAEEIHRQFSENSQRILILSGNGNNGGDAIAIGRLLHQRGHQITVCMALAENSGETIRFSESAALQFGILQKMKIKTVTELPDDSYDIIVDGIFGVGLKRPVTGKAAAIIAAASKRQAYKIALDIPSGIDSTTGAVHGCAFKADETITFGFYKRGLFLFPGTEYCGRIIKKEIGITKDAFLGKPPVMRMCSCSLPPRVRNGHKGTFGKVLVVGGSKDVAGAPYFSARAALMSGCGMVKVCIHRSQQPVIAALLPEALISTYETPEEAEDVLQKDIAWADVIAMGPGMGCDAAAKHIWNTVIRGEKKPLVLDADGLNLLAEEENGETLSRLQHDRETVRELILTPHLLELSRISGRPVRELSEDISGRIEGLRHCATKYRCTVAVKDARTLIGDPSEALFLNVLGNSGMATAGSGDVLTGIIAALKAQDMAALDAAVTGVCVHARSGDLGASEKGTHSLTASDLCRMLPEVLRETLI
ncbi:MAG: NAD(P)H-hydrate dehydratase [Lachnospiraceae bacterium]|nr:NAD(P)H-hydrate dehydratase [Lachnospiraceae bacterium]